MDVKNPTQTLEEVVVMDKNAPSPKISPPDTLPLAMNNSELMTRGTETRKSKMRFKAYFQRCKEALIGTPTTTTPTEENCPVTHQSSTSSWYLDDENKQNTSKSENIEEKTLITGASNANVPDGKNNNNKIEQIGHEKSDFCVTLTTNANDSIITTNSNDSLSRNENMNGQLLFGERDANGKNKVQSFCLKSNGVQVSF